VSSFHSELVREFGNLKALPSCSPMLRKLIGANPAEKLSRTGAEQIVRGDANIWQACGGVNQLALEELSEALPRANEIGGDGTCFALYAAILDLSERLTDPASPSDRTAPFWTHSLLVSYSAMMVSHLTHENPGHACRDAMWAGLFHDFGTIVMQRYYPSVIAKVRQIACEHYTSIPETEQFILKCDHGSVGGLLLKTWGLPAEIQDAVSWHHRPGASPRESRKLTQSVHVAEFVAMLMGAGDTGEGNAPSLSESAWHDLSLNHGDIPVLIEGMPQAAAGVKSVVAGLQPPTRSMVEN
jgi:hypothetical protein